MTLELAVDPPGATLETGFRWRLSSAEVGVSGPFSLFPGLQRTLLLLEGNGFRLDFGDRGRVELREPLLPVAFSGDWPAAATLIDGPCTDLNLMVDPSRCSADLEVWHLSGTRCLDLEGATSLVFVARGTLCIPVWGLKLDQRHTLRVDEGAGTIGLAAGVGGATLVVVSIRSRCPTTNP